VRQGKSDPAPLLAFIKKYPEGNMVRDAYTRLAAAYYGRSSAQGGSGQILRGVHQPAIPRTSWPTNAWVRRILQDKEPLDKAVDLALKGVDLAQGPMKMSAFQSLAQVYLAQGTKPRPPSGGIDDQDGGRAAGRTPDAGKIIMGHARGRRARRRLIHYLLNAARIFMDGRPEGQGAGRIRPGFPEKTHGRRLRPLWICGILVGQSLNLESAWPPQEERRAHA